MEFRKDMVTEGDGVDGRREQKFKSTNNPERDPEGEIMEL